MSPAGSPRLSAVVIARNEEPRIGACLAALAFADERIVIDNGSTDRTAAIATASGARVVSQRTGDFSSLRNTGLKEARGTWILYIDADETVTPELQQAIMTAMESTGNDSPVGYFLRRQNHYLGHAWPTTDRMQRLFVRAKLIGWEGKVHETARIDGAVGELSPTLRHDTHRTIEEMVAKTNEWSAIEAKLRFDAGHPPVVWWRLFRVMLTGFWQSFIVGQGYRAGTAGWVEGLFQAFSMFVTYAKLWEMQQVAGRAKPPKA